MLISDRGGNVIEVDPTGQPTASTTLPDRVAAMSLVENQLIVATDSLGLYQVSLDGLASFVPIESNAQRIIAMSAGGPSLVVVTGDGQLQHYQAEAPERLALEWQLPMYLGALDSTTEGPCRFTITGAGHVLRQHGTDPGVTSPEVIYSGPALDLAAVEGDLFVARGPGGVEHLRDACSDPEPERERLGVAGISVELALVDSGLVVAASDSGVQNIRLLENGQADLSEPVEVQGLAHHLDSDDQGQVYVGTRFRGTSILVPQLEDGGLEYQTSITSPLSVAALAVQGERLLEAGVDRQLYVYDLASDGMPHRSGIVPLPDDAADVGWSDSRVVVALRHTGLLVMDPGAATADESDQRVLIPGGVDAIDRSNRVWLASRSGGLWEIGRQFANYLPSLSK